MVIHVVQRGDTLWAISQTYGVPINQIVSANELESPNNLVIGLALVIPTSYKVHMVRSGETLWQIANQYQVPLQELIRQNNIQNPNVLFPGTRLTIPFRKPIIDVNAYTTNQGEQAGKEIQEVGSLLTYASPFAYTMTADGGLTHYNCTTVKKTYK